MHHLLKKHETKLRFALVGGFNTALDFGILFALTLLGGVPKELSNIISTSITFVISFFANKSFTFKSTSKNAVHQMVLFTIVTLFGLWVIQTLIVFAVTPLVMQLGASEAIALFAAKMLATLASLIWNYLFYSRLVFKD